MANKGFSFTKAQAENITQEEQLLAHARGLDIKESEEQEATERPADTTTNADYSKMTKAQLLAECDSRGVKANKKAKNADLIALLEAEKGEDVSSTDPQPEPEKPTEKKAYVRGPYKKKGERKTGKIGFSCTSTQQEKVESYCEENHISVSGFMSGLIDEFFK